LREVILTLNLPEELPFHLGDFSLPLRILNNSEVRGFGSNHNQAFRAAQGDYFCVLNPDIRLLHNPFVNLQDCLGDPGLGAVAPMVLRPSGLVEISARRFPTFLKILFKAFSKKWTVDYILQDKNVDVDWVGGMFMLFRRDVFGKFGGFDEGYFLYYEDVNLCARLNLAGLRVVVNPSVQVVHHAQHSSHRNLKYLRWHVGSLLRFLTSSEYQQLKRLNRL
jgi:GT2 family glycosyltransferase